MIPLTEAAQKHGQSLQFPHGDCLVALLPGGDSHQAAQQLYQWLETDEAAKQALQITEAELLVPIERPNKLFLLAGNYAKHIEEGGDVAVERAETFPYVFMKPPTTTLTAANQPILVPTVSPNAIDWELELAVVIGKTARHVKEADALDYVAGYTIINDISDRKFRPNPNRRLRDRDKFFDWLHGKWHDRFCPCGPCIASADSIADPQALKMELKVNGETKQDASTAQQIFPVAAVIEFISDLTTLEPGDIISTGTPSGVGNASGQYLHAGDRMEAAIESIGCLQTPVQAE